ncbi:catalase domain-containing protein [Bimuria novae-zelandiae CBS 107.79]|uniref:Catalase domain-containing protein n=1 Tax=Bimuria novae-zelandiae CBS 107.79 TaxID=1447943 RepID=A0A6A5VBA2_9PLEO|nr:catalase domain-containing protein [Bimuria novae-zelandiae CBS 107.79]
MPLSADTQILETATGLVNALRSAQPPGTSKSFRPAHAKGHLLTSTFTPSPTASTLSSAPHFNLPSTPLTIRFSSSTGLPAIQDTDPNSNPRGIALRFHIPSAEDGKRRHTDIIAHSTPFFPVRSGEDFLALLQALGAGGDAVPKFLGEHPETKRFLDAPKPSPESFATARYWGVNAFVFTNEEGKETTVRYQIVPVAGEHSLSPSQLSDKSENYLFEELAPRLSKSPIVFKLQAQIAQEGDVTDDATVLWPEEREVVELGEVRIEKVKGDEESLSEQKKVIFDPVPRVKGVRASADPLVEMRANIYLVSGRERREAEA